MPKYTKKDYICFSHHMPKWTKRDIYDIPFIKNDTICISKIGNGVFFENYKNIKKNEKFSKEKIIHFFIYDKYLEPLYRNPYKYIEKLSKYKAICSPDFSVYDDMDFHDVYDAIYKNRYVGCVLQNFGISVIPTVGWCKKEYDDICFAGLEEGGIYVISSLGIKNNESKKEFIRGFKELIKRKKPKAIICIGEYVDGLDYDICYVPYIESFGNQYKNGWQQKLFNWDYEKEDNYYGIKRY